MEHFTTVNSFMKEKVIIRAELMQQAFHEFIEATVAKNNKISYQDAANTFFILKICEIQEDLRLLAINT